MRRLLVIILLLCVSATAQAYPSSERKSLSLGLSQSTQFAISDDNTSLYVCYGNTFQIVSTATFALLPTAQQPFAISTDTTTYPGNFTGLIYSAAANAVYCLQDNGKMIRYNLADVTAAPTIITVAAGKQLGFGVADTVGDDALYIVNVTDTSIIKYTISTGAVATIALTSLPIVGGFTINNIVLVPQSTVGASEIYLSTNKGAVIYFNLSSLTPQIVTVDATSTHQLKGIYPTPNSLFLYVVDTNAVTVTKILVSSHAVVNTGISMLPNGNLNQLLVTDVTNPTGVYGYVVGTNSISIFDTANDTLFDFIVATTDKDPLSVSGVGPMVSSTDAYVYISAASGNIGVVSDNPYVTVNSVTYPTGQTTVGVGQSVTVSFQADEVGTYTIRSGGGITADGTLLKDSSDNTSGTVATAATAQSVVIPYDSNSAAFLEGANTVFFFVTDSSSNVGRMATTITVDTPPPAVTVLGSSFGNQKAYINFTRLTASDISYYRIYASTDATTVTTTTTVATTVTQGSDATLTGTVTGLSNSTLYYLAIDAVDNNGNVGPRTSTLSNGSSISATPQQTVGPAGLSGETGCSLTPRVREGKMVLGMMLLMLTGLLTWRRRYWRLLGLVLIAATLCATPALAQTGDGSAFKRFGWSVDMRLSLWQPTASATKTFFPAFFNWTGSIGGGFLYNEQIGAEASVGVFYKTGKSVSAATGAVSQDAFKLLTIPMTLGGNYHFLYSRKQPVAPYVRGGLEFDYFRENDDGNIIKGVKKGLYGGGGLQIPISRWLEGMDAERHGDSQVYIITEAIYRWVNDFGAAGLDLSGANYSLGVLFTF